MNAALVLAPAVGPVQMDYCAEGTAGLPAAWANRFFVALSGTPRKKGTEDRRGKGVYVLHYGLRERRMVSVPSYLIQYRGTEFQAVVGLACGPDAVYVVPIFPDATGVTAVLAVKYDPSAPHPYGLAGDAAPLRLMEDRGCFGCHALGGKGGTAGPALDRHELVARLTQRLSSDEYRRTVDWVDTLPAEPFLSNREARHDVLALQGLDRVRLWMRHHIRQPKFDNPMSQMPALDMSDADAVALTDFLLGPPKPVLAPSKPVAVSQTKPKGRPKPKLRYRHVALAFMVGLALGGTGALAARRWRHGRARS